MQSVLNLAFFLVSIYSQHLFTRHALLQEKKLSDCVILGDKDCFSQSTQLNLFNEVTITLVTPKRSNQKDNKLQSYSFRK